MSAIAEGTAATGVRRAAPGRPGHSVIGTAKGIRRTASGAPDRYPDSVAVRDHLSILGRYPSPRLAAVLAAVDAVAACTIVGATGVQPNAVAICECSVDAVRRQAIEVHIDDVPHGPVAGGHDSDGVATF